MNERGRDGLAAKVAAGEHHGALGQTQRIATLELLGAPNLHHRPTVRLLSTVLKNGTVPNALNLWAGSHSVKG